MSQTNIKQLPPPSKDSHPLSKEKQGFENRAEQEAGLGICVLTQAGQALVLSQPSVAACNAWAH